MDIVGLVGAQNVKPGPCLKFGKGVLGFLRHGWCIGCRTWSRPGNEGRCRQSRVMQMDSSC